MHISIRELKGARVATVTGITSHQLLSARVSETQDGGEQISRCEYGAQGNVLQVHWCLRRERDALGQASALPWESRDEADHVTLGLGSLYSGTGARLADEVRFQTRCSALAL